MTCPKCGWPDDIHDASCNTCEFCGDQPDRCECGPDASGHPYSLTVAEQAQRDAGYE
jgi:hypothetical protein